MGFLLEYLYYINLDQRTDRCLSTERQIQNLNRLIGSQKIVPQRFSAILHSNGAIGCTSSHIQCLELAKQREYPYVCIMEDDILFTNPNLFLRQLRMFQNEMNPNDWDVLILGGNIIRYNSIEKTSCKRVLKSTTTTGYIVQQHYYDTLLHNFKSGLALLTQYPERSDEYAIDQYWSRLQERDRWFVIVPLTINQAISYSDIEKRMTDRNRGMLKRI